MGHDIYAYTSRECIHEIAYLRRGAFRDENHKLELYHALRAESSYARVSGNGDLIAYSRNQIEDALKFAEDNNYPNDVIDFFDNCQQAFKNNILSAIYVYFG